VAKAPISTWDVIFSESFDQPDQNITHSTRPQPILTHAKIYHITILSTVGQLGQFTVKQFYPDLLFENFNFNEMSRLA